MESKKGYWIMKPRKSLIALTCFAMAACSPAKDATDSEGSGAQTAAIDASDAAPASVPPLLTTAGLADLKIGGSVPAPSSWSAPASQAADGCATSKSPTYKGVYAILEQGKVQRITLGPDSNVKLAGGIGIGSSEAEVKKQFSGLREEGHKYDPSPAKYLTAADASPTKYGLRFEIKADGTVGTIHAGRMPVLAYVEGCG
jgi:hypothetical protein